ncbi:nuclear transport factor 2 family protein [Oxynema sp. CENA135]|uniref:nuclear transport factor 2 family protein n=1 Tax=Oxynema sp. CENA135 TaxID=984206 RepID=UPI0019098278|nr:nuclear transport factor 2 family protein [Oxynema sp. CENA135]MBK4731801.1 nuclear transport factor 2 family protein [Oxynema sp. CENA135]
MRNFPPIPALSLTVRDLGPIARSPVLRWLRCRSLASVLLSATLWTAGGIGPHAIAAASQQQVPPTVTNLIRQIDGAANRQDLGSLLQFYSPRFTHSDGLTRETLAAALTRLWERYPDLDYRTRVESWEAVDNGFEVETVTEIEGTGISSDRAVRLRATLRSRQRYENGQMVRQDLLAENTEVTSGDNPPEVKVNLPDEVRVGGRYNFDAIVLEPLRDDLLLGYAIDEPARADRLLNPSEVQLQPLAAGGIFKVGRAGAIEDSLWISAALFRHDGLSLITRRLRILDRGDRNSHLPF